MTRAAVELNDAGILVVHDSAPESPRGAPSPGYALLDGGELLAGRDAADAARLKPRLAQSRFWSELSTRPLGRPFPRELSAADLAHAHLSAVWRVAGSGVDEAILALPGSFTTEQLGLLLGVARAAGLPASGLVDAAVAASCTRSPEERRVLHLDLELHRAVLTEIEAGPEAVRGRVQVETGTGLAPILDALAKRVARLFVQDTRFDPLHAAETERRLYRELPLWLSRLRREETFVVAMETGGREHALELSWPRLAEACETPFRILVRLLELLAVPEEPASLLLSDRAGGLPGLVPALEEAAGAEALVLPVAAAATGALRAAARIRAPGEELPFVTRLPRRQAVTLRPPPPAAPGRSAAGPPGSGPPTHLLVDSVAHPIAREALVLGSELPAGGRGIRLEGETAGLDGLCCEILLLEGEVVLRVLEDRGGAGARLNGRRVEGRATLATGDRLRLGDPGVELRLIRVAEGHGPAQG